MAQDDKVWRQFIDTLSVPDEGDDAPDIESIAKKKRAPARKFFVQKIVTEVYVYTDIENHVFAENTFQDLIILGEMSEAKLNKILDKRRNQSS